MLNDIKLDIVCYQLYIHICKILVRNIINILMIVIFLDGIRILFSSDIFFCIYNIFYNKHIVKITHIVKK